MTDSEWGTVDRYLVDTLIGDGDTDVARANSESGLPAIDVSPPQGKFLHLIALTARARRVLEIGTLGGYSTLWLARAVGPQGRVVTLEFDAHHAEVARANLDRKGVGERVEIRIGAALDVLPGVEQDNPEPFDLVFIDADKINNAEYVRWALRLTRPGSVVIVDNVVRRGALAGGDPDDPGVRGAREALQVLAAEPRLDATVLQTVGGKGWDGFAYAVVVAD
ncbi:O-methyltransferase [Nocardia vermiculata]|uniref:O-methyltransferase n=1 Tax=Nocardia vermiculata TaxID=257274 RepID=A0A846Y4L6_9NOCA|nr:O-methyltransferase [Nocardia vermiculata]NKY52794.1 O-methyltransferase [Nocardia vermiculata]